MGVGTNRINKYTLGKSTQGLSDYLHKSFPNETPKAVIAFDCRNNSKSLAKLVADVFSANGIELNIEKHIVSKNGKTIELTQKEFSLLEYMIRNKGKVCRRTRIIEKVWDIHFDYDNSVIDVYVNALRKKLDEPHNPSIITTVRGIGYKIEED